MFGPRPACLKQTLFLNGRRIESAKFQEGIGQRLSTQQALDRLVYLVGQVPKESFDIARDDASVGDIATSGPQPLVAHSRLVDFAERDRGGVDAQADAAISPHGRTNKTRLHQRHQ